MVGRHFNNSFKSLWLCLVLSAGCLASAAATADLTIDRAWVSLAPPGTKVNSAFLHISNTGDAPIIIESFSANCCDETKVHSTRYENGKVVIEQLERLSVPAKGKVVMKPGSLHIMLMNPKPALALDDKVELNLHFAGGKQQTVLLPVLDE